MADILVAAAVQPLDDVRTALEDGRVDVVRPRQGKLVEHIEIMPEADAVAVVAPRIVAVALGRGGARRVDTETCAKGEIFDVVAKGDGEPSAFRPVVLRPFVNRDVVVTAVRRELHLRIAYNSGIGPSPPPSPRVRRIAGRGRDPRSGRVRNSSFTSHRPWNTGLRFSMNAVRP